MQDVIDTAVKLRDDIAELMPGWEIRVRWEIKGSADMPGFTRAAYTVSAHNRRHTFEHWVSDDFVKHSAVPAPGLIVRDIEEKWKNT